MRYWCFLAFKMVQHKNEPCDAAIILINVFTFKAKLTWEFKFTLKMLIFCTSVAENASCKEVTRVTM